MTSTTRNQYFSTKKNGTKQQEAVAGAATFPDLDLIFEIDDNGRVITNDGKSSVGVEKTVKCSILPYITGKLCECIKDKLDKLRENKKTKIERKLNKKTTIEI